MASRKHAIKRAEKGSQQMAMECSLGETQTGLGVAATRASLQMPAGKCHHFSLNAEQHKSDWQSAPASVSEEYNEDLVGTHLDVRNLLLHEIVPATLVAAVPSECCMPQVKSLASSWRNLLGKGAVASRMSLVTPTRKTCANICISMVLWRLHLNERRRGSSTSNTVDLQSHQNKTEQCPTILGMSL